MMKKTAILAAVVARRLRINRPWPQLCLYELRATWPLASTVLNAHPSFGMPVKRGNRRTGPFGILVSKFAAKKAGERQPGQAKATLTWSAEPGYGGCPAKRIRALSQARDIRVIRLDDGESLAGSLPSASLLH